MVQKVLKIVLNEEASLITECVKEIFYLKENYKTETKIGQKKPEFIL